MDQDYIPKEESKLMLLKPVLVVLLLIVIVAAVLFGGWRFLSGWVQNNLFDFNKNKVEQSEESGLLVNVSLNDETVDISNLQGLLLLSAEDSELNTIQTYSLNLNLETPEIKNESEYFGILSSSFIEFTNASEPGGFFFKSFVDVSSDETTDSTSVNAIFRFDSEDRSIDQITSDPGQQGGVMSWSKEVNRLAYTTLRESYGNEDSSLVWNWNVNVVDVDSEVDHVVEGAVNPAWSPDGTKLLYLKSSGVYVYDFEVEEEIAGPRLKFNDDESLPRLSTMLDLSPDGNYLLMTGQGAGQIEVFKVTWEPLNFEFVGRIFDSSVNYSWPVISPDGKTYAVLTRDIVDGEVVNPRIEIRPLLGRSVIYSYPLTELNTNSIFLDDWIARPLEL